MIDSITQTTGSYASAFGDSAAAIPGYLASAGEASYTWVITNGAALGTFVGELAQTVSDFALPYLASAWTLLAENQIVLGIGTAGAVVLGGLYKLFTAQTTGNVNTNDETPPPASPKGTDDETSPAASPKGTDDKTSPAASPKSETSSTHTSSPAASTTGAAPAEEDGKVEEESEGEGGSTPPPADTTAPASTSPLQWATNAFAATRTGTEE